MDFSHSGQPPASTMPSPPTSLKVGAILVLLCFSTLVLIRVFSEGGLTRFGGFGEGFAHRYIDEIEQMGAYIKPNSGGYDGQFYAQLATDPTLQDPAFKEAIDEPAYRARRILLPLISNLIAFGDPQRSILIYCALNIVLWYGFAWFIWNWLQVRTFRDFGRWIACIFSMGVMDSVKYALTDLPSIFLLLAMIRYANSHRFAVSGGFIASLFLKETNVLAMTAIPKLEGGFRNWIRPMIHWFATAILSLVLFYGWYRYINLRFDTFHGVSGNFDWPFSSMLRNLWVAVREISSGNWDDRYSFRLLATIGFLIQWGFLLTRMKDFRNPLVRLGLVYGLLFIFLGDLVWWGYWAVCRVALPMTIAFNLLYVPKNHKWFWLGLVVANLSVIHAIYRFI